MGPDGSQKNPTFENDESTIQDLCPTEGKKEGTQKAEPRPIHKNMPLVSTAALCDDLFVQEVHYFTMSFLETCFDLTGNNSWTDLQGLF